MLSKNKTLLLLFLLSIVGFSQNTENELKNFNTQNKLAIEGYDPVSYFIQNKAVKGKKENDISYKGVLYYFSTKENKALFTKNPTTYLPQYGGWCAYAMGETGEKIPINPTTFKIVEGKLYLFYNAFFNNTLKPWNKNETTLKAKADKNWKKIAE